MIKWTDKYYREICFCAFVLIAGANAAWIGGVMAIITGFFLMIKYFGK